MKGNEVMSDEAKFELEETLIGINRQILKQKAIHQFLMYQAREMQLAIKSNEQHYANLVADAKLKGLEGRYLTPEELATLPASS
jgi:hypothetical protein